MQNVKKWTAFLLLGGLSSALLLLSIDQMLRGMGSLIAVAGSSFGLDAAETGQIAQILAQLGDAELHIPLWIVLVLCFAAAFIAVCVVSREKRRSVLRIAAMVVVWLLFLIIVFALALWFTEVNTIRVGAILRSLLILL